jgi:cytoskeletal protein CcmA (bactofilin family)
MAEPTQTTVIGADTKIKGEMTFENTARLLGQFEGKITAKGELQVADGAACRAAVEAGKVVVDGLVEGNVHARDRIELTARAKMKGDIAASKLVVAEGATLVGHVSVGPEAGKSGMTGSMPGQVEAKPGQPIAPPSGQQGGGR